MKNKLNWKKEWIDMPEYFVPTRDTKLRNSYDITDVINYNKNTKTSLFPKYPIYIISKGRAKSQLTAKALTKLNIDFKVVIEPQEFNEYSKYIDKNKILVLPFQDLGYGSIPARNWVWEHAVENGFKKHWILDDNINGFGTQKYGRRINTNCGDFFAQCENFSDKYNNIALTGIRYRFHHNYTKSPYLLNTRIYSCILITNDIPFRWRGKYNEDTDLSLRALKANYATLLFTWCYCNKASTMTMEGGNTDNVYTDNDNRLRFAESLQDQHPDVVKVVWKYNRWHHLVNYKPFINNNLNRLDK